MHMVSFVNFGNSFAVKFKFITYVMQYRLRAFILFVRLTS